MENSILISTKQILGIDQGYDAFDLDIITHINMTFGTLHQLGVGPTPSFSIEGDDATWEDIGLSAHTLNLVKTYVFLKTRIVFDPPGTSFLLTAAKEQISELEWRISTFREVELNDV